ncbi:MAG: hypothetical protein ACRBDL_02035 [Alphaproteobacteria bacterium]
MTSETIFFDTANENNAEDRSFIASIMYLTIEARAERLSSTEQRLWDTLDCYFNDLRQQGKITNDLETTKEILSKMRYLTKEQLLAFERIVTMNSYEADQTT